MSDVSQQQKVPDSDFPAVSDDALIRLVCDSDEAAFKQLYYRYYLRLFKFVWRRVEDDEVAKDLLQVLFMRVWQGRERLDASRTIKAYLYQIATNLVIDHFRQQGRKLTESVASFEEEPLEEMDKRFELEEEIVRAVAALPEPLQQVFKMSRFDGLKNSQIASQLHISVKTVESRMTKAFSLLRERLLPFMAVLLAWLAKVWKL